MAVKIEYEADHIYVLRISGILRQSEFGAEQSALAGRIDSGSKPRLLVILEQFEGWHRGADLEGQYGFKEEKSGADGDAFRIQVGAVYSIFD